MKNNIKFSIIIPLYNVEQYIVKCLDSIINQSYDNYEVIIINDGSKDNSSLLVQPYLKDKRFKEYKKKNGGLSSARNLGVKKAKGDYIIFIDSDDSIEHDYLKVVNKYLSKNNVDLLKIKTNIIIEGISKQINDDIIFDNLKGDKAYELLSKAQMLDPAWLYVYRTNFYIKNKFSFAHGLLHEDFGLIPIIILTANTVSSIDYYGYNYLIRPNSITTRNDNYFQKCNDILEHFINYKIYLNKKPNKLLGSVVANNVITSAKNLNDEDLKKYIIKLKTESVFDYLIEDSLIRKIKKYFIKMFPQIYIKYFIK